MMGLPCGEKMLLVDSINTWASVGLQLTVAGEPPFGRHQSRVVTGAHQGCRRMALPSTNTGSAWIPMRCKVGTVQRHRMLVNDLQDVPNLRIQRNIRSILIVSARRSFSFRMMKGW